MQILKTDTSAFLGRMKVFAQNFDRQEKPEQGHKQMGALQTTLRS